MVCIMCTLLLLFVVAVAATFLPWLLQFSSWLLLTQMTLLCECIYRLFCSLQKPSLQLRCRIIFPTTRIAIEGKKNFQLQKMQLFLLCLQSKEKKKNFETPQKKARS